MAKKPTVRNALTDFHGDPVYIDFEAGFGTDDGKLTPGVNVTINGSTNTIPVPEAWKQGLALLLTASRLEELEEITGGAVLPAIGFGAGDGPRIELRLDTAGIIAGSLLGAAISAVHDMTVWRHLTRKMGWTDEAAAELFDTIESVPVLDYLSGAATTM